MAHRAVVCAALALILAGCGGADEPPAGEEDEVPATMLEVTLRPDGRDGGERRATLTCDPAGGTHPDPAAACAALAENRDALDPVPDDAVCTQIYGGPAEAEISGTVEGEPVSASLSRQNGCEIARWDALEPVLALAGP